MGPTVNAGIGGNLAQYLSTSDINMIEFDLEYGDDKNLHHVIKIQVEARSHILKNNQVVYVSPPELPMVVKPKPYIQSDDHISLGGYLNNDVFYTKSMFIDKVGYKNSTVLNKENDVINLINGMNSVKYKINKDTLDFINMYGVEKGIILSPPKDQE